MSTFHRHGITAIWRRQLGSMLGNPLGYVFITAFVVINSVILFWPDSFYSRNIADLGPLFPVLPWLLVILLPSLAMGSWSTEREQGTEELLLTLPLGIIDALLGKYLAIVSYFTLALACSLTNVGVLMWLGHPDLGLVAANYVGWWLAGLAFAGLGLLASVQVGSAAIAFVIGAVYCGLVMWGANHLNWFDAFNRGVIPLSGIITSLAVAVASFSLALIHLASRRWRVGTQDNVLAQSLSMLFGLILAVNVAMLSQEHNFDADISVEGLASISPASGEIISTIKQPVEIAAFISDNLPPDLQLKSKEVEDKLLAVERASHGKVTLKIKHPSDASDADGTQAERDYGVKPFKAIVDTVSGHEEVDVFLGAAVVCGSRSQVINSFDPGLSVEFELVRAVRSVSLPKKKVLGIASTDLKMTADFDFQTYQQHPAWGLIDEWKKQYELRDVNLDSDVVKEVDVLVVPLPSSLTQPQVEHLHDYIWSGRPALLLEDPLPYFNNPQLAPTMPKKSAGNPYQQNPEAPQKGDLTPLYHALGVEFPLDEVLWSEYVPNHQLSGSLPPGFVWVTRDQHGVLESPITTGIDSVMLPFPGGLLEAADKRADLHVARLLQPCVNSPWGQLPFKAYIQQGMMGLQQLHPQPTDYVPGDPSHIPALAVEITGTMGSAYPEPDEAAEKGASAKEPKDKNKDQSKLATGIPSHQPIHVVLVADTDLASDTFFNMYRNGGGQIPEDQRELYTELFALRNVQFLANAVDALAGDQAFLAVRNRHPQLRPLTSLEGVMVETQNFLSDETIKAQKIAEAAIKKTRATFDAQIAQVDTRTDLDENAKDQLKEQLRTANENKLNEQLKAIEERKDSSIHGAKIMGRREITHRRYAIKLYAVGTPALLMLILVLTIAFNRVRLEQSHIPAKRKRIVA